MWCNNCKDYYDESTFFLCIQFLSTFKQMFFALSNNSKNSPRSSTETSLSFTELSLSQIYAWFSLSCRNLLLDSIQISRQAFPHDWIFYTRRLSPETAKANISSHHRQLRGALLYDMDKTWVETTTRVLEVLIVNHPIHSLKDLSLSKTHVGSMVWRKTSLEENVSQKKFAHSAEEISEI